MRRALAFLTLVGGPSTPDARTMAWFPPAGAVIGALVGAAWWSGDRVWSPLLAAAFAVAVDLGVTGLLHADGLADSADGLLPHATRERRLAIMAEPTTGAYGVVAVVVVVLLRTAALASVAPDVALVAALWCASRTGMAVAARALPYARTSGLATDLLGGAWPPVAVTGLLVSGASVLLADGLLQPALAIGALVAAGAGVLAIGHRRLGGFTGDVLGAAGIIGETAGLLVAAAAW